MSESKAVLNLSSESRGWYRKLKNEYGIDDRAGLFLLLNLCESFDKMRACQREIEKDGAVLVDRFGQKKCHPLSSVERDAKSQMLSCLKLLNLDLEPLHNDLGRPPGP